MQFAVKIFLFLFAIFAVAAAYPEPSHKPSPTTSSKAPQPTGKCKYGPPLCCETVEPAYDGVIGALLELLGIIVQDLSTVCGTSCDTIDLTNVGAGSEWYVHVRVMKECHGFLLYVQSNWNPVCCQENSWGIFYFISSMHDY